MSHVKVKGVVKPTQTVPRPSSRNLFTLKGDKNVKAEDSLDQEEFVLLGDEINVFEDEFKLLKDDCSNDDSSSSELERTVVFKSTNTNLGTTFIGINKERYVSAYT